MRRILFLSLIIVLAAPGFAASRLDLYSGDVPVQGQGQVERADAFPRALKQVLGKLSGLRHFDDRPLVAPALADAGSLVVAFHYRQQSLPDGAQGPESETRLVVRFSQPDVDALMRSLALPLWPPDRAPLGIWLVIDDGQSRRVLPVEYGFLREPLTSAAEIRGLPLEWPEPDQTGDYGVDVQLLWGGYTEALGEGDGDRNVLLAAARREGPEWNVRFILEYHGAYWSWRGQHIDLQAVLSDAIHQAADEITAAHTIAASDQGSRPHEIVVAGLGSADDYARCMSYLQGLSVVDGVSVQSAEPGRVRMVLEINATPDHFDAALADDGVLEYDDTARHYTFHP